VLTPDGQLLAGSYNFILYSLDPQSGTEKWPFKQAKNHYIGNPLANQAGIFAPSSDHHLYALDLAGNFLWSYQTEGPLWAQPVGSSDGSRIYFAAMDHHVYAVDSKSGKKIWISEDLGGALVGTPALSPEGVLFIGTFNQEMLAIDSKNGRVSWKKPTDGWVWGGPAWKDGILYFGDLKGAFYAIRASNGEIVWKITPDGPIAQTPLLTDDAIYFTTEAGTIYAIDYKGVIRWNVTIGGKLHTSPVLAGDKILVAPTNFDQYLVALDKNGTQIWQYAPEKK
jgi:outer membrane protein assembly factor BamB